MISWWNSSISHSSVRCPVLFFNHCVFTVSRCQFLHLILGMKHFGKWCVSRLFEKKEHKYQKGSKMQMLKKHGTCTTSGLKEMRCFFAKSIVVDGSSHIAGYDMSWHVMALWFPAKCRWFHLAWRFPLQGSGVLMLSKHHHQTFQVPKMEESSPI